FKQTDKYNYTRSVKVYESNDCTDCRLRSLCTKAKEGNNRRLYYNETWEQQKEYIGNQLSEEKTNEIYRKRKVDVESVFGFLKANLGFTRFSVRSRQKVKSELVFVFMAVNLRKYTANCKNYSLKELRISFFDIA